MCPLFSLKLSRTLLMDRTTIIEAQIPTVHNLINGFVARNPNFSNVVDDLISTGMVKLIETVDRFFLEKREFNAHFRNYVRISIVTGVSDFIRSNAIIPTPKNSWTPCERLTSEPIAPEIGLELTRVEALNKLFDTLRDETDINIVLSKLSGARTAKEVAKLTGLSTTTIYRRLRIIRSRYQK